MQQNIFKYVPVLAIALSAFLIVQTVGVVKSYRYIGGENVPSNVITVSGEGEVFAPADIASFTFSVQTNASTVALAQEMATEAIDSALTKLKDLGIEDRDIKTLDYSVYPKYEYDQVICTDFRCPPSSQRLVGYEVNQTISVKVRNVEKAGNILGSLGDTGVTNVSGLSFTIDDEDALNREARKMAIEDAREKAEELAKDLGVRLVRIISFSEGGNGYYPAVYRTEALGMGGGADAKAEPQIPVGENKIISNVTITYEIR